jgi:hypothetical protein
MQGVATPCAKPGSAPLDHSCICRSDLATRPRGVPLTHGELDHGPNSRYAEHRPSLLLAHHKRLPNRDHYLALLNRAHRSRGRGPDCVREPFLRKDRVEAGCRASR